jgi:hypothetical protein
MAEVSVESSEKSDDEDLRNLTIEERGEKMNARK